MHKDVQCQGIFPHTYCYGVHGLSGGQVYLVACHWHCYVDKAWPCVAAGHIAQMELECMPHGDARLIHCVYYASLHV